MTRSVSRALAVFDAFDEEQLSLTLQQIGVRTGIGAATTYRLVNALEQAGFLVRLESQEYCLSMKLVRLAGLVRGTAGIRNVCRPKMVEIAKATGETVTINEISGCERMCIDVIDTPSPLMTILRPGERLPLLKGATGKVLLAYRTAKERESIIRRSPRAEPIDRKKLEKELNLIRDRGYAMTRSERIPGVTAIAVPLRDMKEEVHYALALTGPSVRMDPRVGEFRKILSAAGSEISLRLGSTQPPRARTHE